MTTDSAADPTAARERAMERAPEVVRSPETDRRLALLWNPPEPSGRGRPARLTLAEVVDTGLAVAADGGLEALSMRRVARELGVGAMTLYTYVPGRTELVDLMTDRVYSDMRHAPPGTGWRAALSQWLTEFWELYQRHPWLLQTNLWRAPLAPSVLDAQEAGARCLVDTALDAVQVTHMMSLVEAALQGSARAALAEAAEGRATGMDTDDYWASMSSFWEDYFDVERYPVMTRLYTAGGYDELTDTFESIRDQLLDSVERAIEQAEAATD
ncbi:MAG: TetR/AcrR family transcriptional regulator [Propionibacteriaceae bacterium]